ncbi:MULTISPECIES: response regulator [Reichenbachiella]|uniref:Two component transcriptional regulator, LuxR family n=1 Tax=Reichenbachiella agariperforans TaxID=156994 RepID=A0A1M6SUX5_REIAG|nr:MULTISPECIES: response regulator transcription factor [Reichenbachiella]MBU2916280.1 response regulator transcription factor [Reichenbachiella agariperforans]RJE75126.1 DNA-binding response regulator [Reichenbachiella sp. MSK19-1]SHK48378.1 two component transcriptional regulator, LuxR family [Reichenbachiella agariperforans]
MKIKLAIVDDHQLFRDGMSALLSSNEDFEVLGGLNNGVELFEFLEKGEIPHVLLLDLTMPEMNGFEALKKLKKEYPQIKTIAISMHDDGNYIVKCVRSGAYSYLLKNTDEEELVQAINTVFSGQKYFNPTISERMINIMAMEGNQPKKLSAKESEILEMISNGLTTKEIAEKLIISTRTVETHRVNMMKKLDVKNTAELIKKATKLSII